MNDLWVLILKLRDTPVATVYETKLVKRSVAVAQCISSYNLINDNAVIVESAIFPLSHFRKTFTFIPFWVSFLCVNIFWTEIFRAWCRQDMPLCQGSPMLLKWCCYLQGYVQAGLMFITRCYSHICRFKQIIRWRWFFKILSFS